VIYPSGVTPGRSEIQVKRTFSGSDGDTWTDFLHYYENIARLNCWDYNPCNRKRMVFFTTLRGQAETFVHGLPNDVQSNWDSLLQRMDLRFGHVNMKESYLAKAKLRRRKPGESFRNLGQVIEDLFRWAYPNNPETVQESSIKYFLDSYGESEEFRLAVRRTKPKDFISIIPCRLDYVMPHRLFRELQTQLQVECNGIYNVAVLYLDDIIVIRDNFEYYIGNLCKVMDRTWCIIYIIDVLPSPIIDVFLYFNLSCLLCLFCFIIEMGISMASRGEL